MLLKNVTIVKKNQPTSKPPTSSLKSACSGCAISKEGDLSVKNVYFFGTAPITLGMLVFSPATQISTAS